MRKWIALVVGIAAAGCGSSTGPTPAFLGNYTLVVEASSVCELLVERYTWDLVGTSSGASDSGVTQYLLTLPGGDTSVAVTLSYPSSQKGRSKSDVQTFNTSVRISAPPPDDRTVRVKYNGGSQGSPSIALDGRGRVLDGNLSGTLEITDTTRRPPAQETCTAADHRWILTPS